MTTLLLLLAPPLIAALGAAVAMALRVLWLRRRLSPVANALGLVRTAALRWEGTVDEVPFLLAAPLIGPVRAVMALRSPSGIALRRRDAVHDQGLPGVVTGDEGFDAGMVLEGDPAHCLVRATPAFRATARDLLGQHALQARARGVDAVTTAGDASAAIHALRALHRTLERPPPALPTRWREEDLPSVRARLLGAHGAALQALAHDDPAPEVQHALALVADDRGGLEASLHVAGPAAEQAFRHLQARDPDALARTLADGLRHGSAPPRAEEFLGRLRWPGLVAHLAEGLDDPTLPLPDARLLRLAAASGGADTALVTLVGAWLPRTEQPEVWRRGLDVLRDRGRPEDVEALGAAPDEPLEQARQRVLAHLGTRALGDALRERFDLQPHDRSLRGHVGPYPLTLTLEPGRNVLTLAELPRTLRFEVDAGPATVGRPVWAFGPARRREARALATGRRLELGVGRPGLFLLDAPHLDLATVDAALAWAHAVAEDAAAAPDARLLEHLATEVDLEWLVAWLEAALEHGLPPVATAADGHADPHVRVCALAWHDDVDGLLQAFASPELPDGARRRAGQALCARPRPPYARMVEADPLRTLTATLEGGPPPEATAALLDALGERATVPALQPALQALVFAAPHPSAEPLWCTWLSPDGRDPAALTALLVAHGTRTSFEALRHAVDASPDHPDTAPRRKALAALRERLQTQGAVSLASGDGALSLADPGEGRLSEPGPPGGGRSP